MDELKTVHHKLLGEGKLIELNGDEATVYFKKRVPLNQIFLSRESMLSNWKKETLDWAEQYNVK